jgi:tetratricopeptide (TPR) repeat protein
VKVSFTRIASLILATVSAIAYSAGQAAQAQTPATQPAIPNQEKNASTSPVQQGMTTREKRAQAYSKILEGQRYLSELRSAGSAETLRLARQAFQDAATLDPNLAEARTALAEIAFYYPPQDLEAAARESTVATKIDPDNFGAHRILSRLYAIRSGLREGSINRSIAELAIKELKEVTRLDKNNAEAWALLGEFYHASGRTKEALDAWSLWAATPPATDIRFFQYMTNRSLSADVAYSRLGEALLEAGRTTEALAAIRRANSLDPDNADYKELLAQSLEAGGVGDEQAIAELKRIVAADAANDSMIIHLARVQARTGHLDDAAATLRAGIARQPKGSREQQALRNILAQVYTDGLRYAEAVAIYEEQLKERNIGNAQLASDEEQLVATRILQRIIEVYKRAGRASDVVATIERMRQLLGKDSPVPDAQYISFLREQGKRTEALQAARSARQRFPEETDFLRLEAQTLTDLGRVDEAVALVRTQLKNSIADADQYLFISSLYLQAGRTPAAIEAARKALDLLAPAEREEMTAAALITLASAQERAGDTKGSEASLRRVLAKDPNNATALNNLGYFLLERNERLDEALEMIQHAFRSNPNNTNFLDSLGWAYFKLGKLDEAERNLKEAARRDNLSATIQEHLGDLYKRRGQLEMARSAWQRALALVVRAEDTARLRAKLGGKKEN